jgi:hypothetical protein
MNERLKYIYQWCDNRGIKQYVKFFRGCSKRQAIYDEEFARIIYVFNAREPRIQESDATWITDMELTIKKLEA